MPPRSLPARRLPCSETSTGDRSRRTPAPPPGGRGVSGPPPHGCPHEKSPPADPPSGRLQSPAPPPPPQTPPDEFSRANAGDGALHQRLSAPGATKAPSFPHAPPEAPLPQQLPPSPAAAAHRSVDTRRPYTAYT